MKLYALTTEGMIASAGYLQTASAVLDAGVNLLQIRSKYLDHSELETRSAALVGLCRQYGVPVILNDSPALALNVGADGVHLGRNDGTISSARSMLGASAMIGVSCYDSLERASTAASEGANYVAFGACFSSTTKPEAPPAPLEIVQSAAATMSIPVCAIGGIDETNIELVCSLGVDMIAVSAAIFDAADAAAATRRLRQRIDEAVARLSV